MPEGKTEFFAAWLHLGDIWKTSGDFSIPRSDPKKYRDLEQGLRAAKTKLDRLDRELKAREAKGEDVKKLRRLWKEAKAAAVHEPGRAVKTINDDLGMIK